MLRHSARLHALTLLASCCLLLLLPARESRANALSAGSLHTCAITPTARVRCWGANFAGQLGDGTQTDRPVPVEVTGITDAIAVSAGAQHTCAVLAGGSVRCWGDNAKGQLGDGTKISRLVPVAVSGLVGATKVVAGLRTSCAIQANGVTSCWGSNDYYQLGIGPAGGESLVPATIPNFFATQVSFGQYHTCAVTTAGGAKCWGQWVNGSLGNAGNSSSVPSDVTGLTSGVRGIAVGNVHTCAVLTSGSVRCWGDGRNGELGNGTTTSAVNQVQVSGLTSGVSAVAAGGEDELGGSRIGFSCARLGSTSVKCWGRNSDGQLGDGTTVQQSTPVTTLALGTGIAVLAAGASHACVLNVSGQISCWGSNSHGQLGNGTPTNALVPVSPVGFATPISSISVRGRYSCARTLAGGLRCWGANPSGQIGDGTTTRRSVPTDVLNLASGVTAAEAGGGAFQGQGTSCAVIAGGALRCWGENGYTQVGDGTTTTRTAPTAVPALSSGVASAQAGPRHACARTTAGAVLCWGDDSAGQLGNNCQGCENPVPTTVIGLASGVSALSVGSDFSCAIASGAAKCWGSNFLGELGNGNTFSSFAPTTVLGLASGVAAIAAGGLYSTSGERNHACALTTDGTMRCWGANADGQLGDGTRTRRSSPAPVSGLAGPVAAIGVGGAHTCAVLTSGSVQCFGRNLYGQLGDGTSLGRTTPVTVPNLSGVVSVSLGADHTCALRGNGSMVCWGGNRDGQIGTGFASYASVAVPAIVATSTPAPGPGPAPPINGPSVAQPVPTASAFTGRALAVSDEVLALGVPGVGGSAGQVLVFDRAAGALGFGNLASKRSSIVRSDREAWPATPSLVLGADGTAAAGDKFGSAIAISRDGATLLIGAPGTGGGYGAVYVYRRAGASWGNTLPAASQVLTPGAVMSALPPNFGAAIDIDASGNAVVGAPGSSVGVFDGAGAAYAYRDSAGTFALNGPVLASPQAVGLGAFGTSVAVDQGIVVVGAPLQGAGAGYVFRPAGGGGFQPALALACAYADQFGTPLRCGAAVDIGRGYVALGAPGPGSTNPNVTTGPTGIVEVFSISANYARRAILLPRPGAAQLYGSSISIQRDGIVAGAPAAAITQEGQGRSYIHLFPDRPWNNEIVVPDVVLGNAVNGADAFGSAIATSGRNLVIGLPTAGGYDTGTGALVSSAGRADTFVFDSIQRDGFE